MRASEMYGKSVVSDGGDQLGHVEELLLSDVQSRAVGILLSGGLLSKQQVLPFEHVKTVGGSAIIVRSAEVTEARDWLHHGEGAHRSRSLVGKEVVTSDGTKLGTISDLILQEGTGRVAALEVAAAGGGRRSGRLLVSVGDDVQLDKDVVVVRDETVRAEEPLP